MCNQEWNSAIDKYRHNIVWEDHNSGPAEDFSPIINKLILATWYILSQSSSKYLFMDGPYERYISKRFLHKTVKSKIFHFMGKGYRKPQKIKLLQREKNK